MKFDIVIPTCNNLLNKNYSLYFTLRSILAQSLQPEKIIVVENLAYSDTKIQIEKDFGLLVEVLDGTKKSKNISYARNVGANYGNSELILFMDDDVVIGKNHFFETILTRMGTLDFACGASRYWTRSDWHEYLKKSYPINHIQNILRYKSYLPKSIERLTGNPSFGEFSFIGHFGIVKREAFNKINGFDEDYKEWSYQDTDLMMRLCAAGFQYDLLSSHGISIFHLSHSADKFAFHQANKELFFKKQKDLGINFRLNHFFGIFDDDKYSILT